MLLRRKFLRRPQVQQRAPQLAPAQVQLLAQQQALPQVQGLAQVQQLVLQQVRAIQMPMLMLMHMPKRTLILTKITIMIIAMTKITRTINIRKAVKVYLQQEAEQYC